MKKVLIANRGEISARVSQTCRALGISSVAVAAATERCALHTRIADETVIIESDATVPYLDIDAIVSAALQTGADAVHPGYGFLSENPSFADAVVGAGLTFVGPSSKTIALLGDKVRARAAAQAVGVPVVPGTSHPVSTADAVVDFGTRHGFPVVIKAAHGGGGRGMRVVRAPAEAAAAVQSAVREASGAFGIDEVFVERYIEDARHIEVQVAADHHGTVLALGDRDCSVQRRNQKLLEEAPALHLPAAVRRAIHDAAVRLARHAGYRGLGTVEFLVSQDGFYFLEVNARIQVEHPVTESVTGLDLIAEQLRIADGCPLSVNATPVPRGHAIEIRLNAEDSARGFAPSSGRLTELFVPHRVGVRFDTGYEPGEDVSSSYDSMIGKLIVSAPCRDDVIRRANAVLTDVRIDGVATSLPAAIRVLTDADFGRGSVSTRWFEDVVEPQLSDPASGTLTPDDAVEVAGRVIRIPRPASGTAPRRSANARRITRQRSSTTTDRDRHGIVTSPMSGTVSHVHITTGERVEAGSTLVTVEAMKLQNAVRATVGGVVTAIEVAVGELVAADRILVHLRPDDADTQLPQTN